MIEYLLTKIASVVFKKALISSGLKGLATAYGIYSAIDTISDVANCVETVNDCSDLGVNGLHVMSDVLSEPVMDRLLDVGGHTFSVEKTNSGIYIASRFVPSFKVTSSSFPSGVFSGGGGSFSTGGKKGFSAGGRGSFSTGGKKF